MIPTYGLEYTPADTWTGTDKISLSDILKHPDVALGQINRNVMTNWRPILIQTAVYSTFWGIARKMLSKPINKVNNSLFGKRGLSGHIGFKL